MHRGRWPYDEKPLLVFWETTKACPLQCKHCRAEAILEPLPGELSTEEGLALIDDVAGFGKPYPILVFTGGDPLMRPDIYELMEHAAGLGMPIAVAPAVSRNLTDEALERIAGLGAAVSLSLDSPWPSVHDDIRGVPGTWERTLKAIRRLIGLGARVQVNTVVMRDTVEGLADLVKLLVDEGVGVWEVFYYVPTGRGGREEDLSPEEWEDVSHFLYEASRHLVVRTTEGPMFRRVAAIRRVLEERGLDPDEVLRPGDLYRRLRDRLVELLGRGGRAKAHTAGTRDGRGIVFISYNGTVYPSGFLPYPLGNVRSRSIVEIYRESPLMRKLRRGEFRGRCGACEYRDLCGGSRARAYAYYGDPLAEDPACPYRPNSYKDLAKNYY